jgi:hypothetical protein
MEIHQPSTITGMGKAALQASLYTLDIWLIVFGLLVAIGAVGGSVAGYLHWRRSGQLQTVLEAENLAQQQEIAKANATAAQAQQRAAEATLELARMKAPRTLTAEPIVSMLKPFAGTPFDVGLVQGDAEAADFMLVLEGVLKAKTASVLPGVAVSETPFSTTDRPQPDPRGVVMRASCRSQRRSLLGSAMGEEAKPELMVCATGQLVVNGSQWRRSRRPVPLATWPPRWETDKPLASIRHRGLGAILSSHLGGVGLDLMAAVPAPQAERNSYETGAPAVFVERSSYSTRRLSAFCLTFWLLYISNSRKT